MRKKICILLVATFLEDRRIIRKKGGYTEASFSVHMHTNCELDALKTILYRTWISIKNLNAQIMERDLHSIISTFRKNRQTKCLAVMTSLHQRRMLCAPLQHVSLGTQLACFVNSYIVLAHACCVSSNNTILVLKLCVLLPDYFQAFLVMCMVGCALACVNFIEIPQKFDNTSSLFF